MSGLTKMRLTIRTREEEGCYVAECQEIGVASCGNTLEEARDNIREAIKPYLENARKRGMLQDVEPVLTVKVPDTAGT